ncbi:MAG: beta-lactamase family protein [Myxococcota bacterium]|nr:beta-lactamase family protein [Myxococcota bacterium]
MKLSLIKRKLGKVERALDKAIEGAEMPGAVVLARMPREGEVLEFAWAQGLSVVRPERLPMTRETVFDLASLTKNIATTTAIMWLVDDGLVALDDPVAKFLPAFAEREKEGVTLRHLLTHSAGLKPWRGYHEPMLEKERKTGQRMLCTAEGREWILDRVLRSARVHEPGEAAVYGDLDFIVLGALVEKVSGLPLERFCTERVFEPLGMKETRFLPLGAEWDEGPGMPDPQRRRIAATENCPWRKRILWGEVHDPNAFAMGGVAGHAGLFAPADDVMRFAQAFLDAWHGRSDALPPHLVKRFAQRQRMPENSDWALGWDTPTPGQSSSGQYFSEDSVGHLGFTGTSLWIDLQSEAIVVMLTNRAHLIAKRSQFTLRPKIHDLIIEGLTAG